MERDPIPLIVLPASVIAFNLFILIWIFSGTDCLVTKSDINGNSLFLSLGAIFIAVGPFLSQIFTAIWKVYLGGFGLFDYSSHFWDKSICFNQRKLLRLFCPEIRKEEQTVQIIFDRYLHLVNPPGNCQLEKCQQENDFAHCKFDRNGLIDYMRRRSAACQSSVIIRMSILLSALLLLVYLISYYNWSHCNPHDCLLLTLYVLFQIFLMYLFGKHQHLNRLELYSAQEYYFTETELKGRISKELETK